MDHYTATLASPLGALLVVVDAAGALVRIVLPGGGAPPDGAMPSAKRCAAACRQLREFFEGGRTQFQLELAPQGTPFQQRVWRALRRIPHGRTITFAELAARVEQPTAVRAVAAANARNPLPIVLPCHRVIGGAGGAWRAPGLEWKEWLRTFEASRPRGALTGRRPARQAVTARRGSARSRPGPPAS